MSDITMWIITLIILNGTMLLSIILGTLIDKQHHWQSLYNNEKELANIRKKYGSN